MRALGRDRLYEQAVSQANTSELPGNDELTRAMFRPAASGNEKDCAYFAIFLFFLVNIRRMPHTFRIDDGFTRIQTVFLVSPIDFLNQGQCALHAYHELVTLGMHLPRFPGRRKRIHTDEAPFAPVALCAFAISLIPSRGAGEFVLDCDGRSESKVNRKGIQTEFDGSVHGSLVRDIPEVTWRWQELPDRRLLFLGIRGKREGASPTRECVAEGWSVVA